MVSGEHFQKCEVCGKNFDMRDLSEVMHHCFTGACATSDEIVKVPYLKSKRIGDNIEYTEDKKPIYLN